MWALFYILQEGGVTKFLFQRTKNVTWKIAQSTVFELKITIIIYNELIEFQ